MSATKERWDRPDLLCPCDAVTTAEFMQVDGGLIVISAECDGCGRRIELRVQAVAPARRTR